MRGAVGLSRSGVLVRHDLFCCACANGVRSVRQAALRAGTVLEWRERSTKATGAARSITGKWETTGKLHQFNYIQLDMLASVHTDSLLSFTAFPHQRRPLKRRGLPLFRNAQQRLSEIQYEAFNFREVGSGVV